jgi:hypothetical protein
MAVATNDIHGAPSSLELDDPDNSTSKTFHPAEKAPTRLENDAQDTGTPGQKKKKKKKSKKSAKAKTAASVEGKAQDALEPGSRPPALCISRNKHWRYISSYHVRVIS